MHDLRASTSQPPERGNLPTRTAGNVTFHPCSKEGGCTFKTGSENLQLRLYVLSEGLSFLKGIPRDRTRLGFWKSGAHISPTRCYCCPPGDLRSTIPTGYSPSVRLQSCIQTMRPEAALPANRF